MSRISTILSVPIANPRNETSMCTIGCREKKHLCNNCYWGGSGLDTPVCDATTDVLGIPQAVYEQILRLSS